MSSNCVVNLAVFQGLNSHIYISHSSFKNGNVSSQFSVVVCSYKSSDKRDGMSNLSVTKTSNETYHFPKYVRTYVLRLLCHVICMVSWCPLGLIFQLQNGILSSHTNQCYSVKYRFDFVSNKWRLIVAELCDPRIDLSPLLFESAICWIQN